tara:strand:+ start:99 stop:227 length:129 start_codon:yes stop_codon:yes gene_type:complete
MKLFDILAVLAVALVMTVAILKGLRLDDEAQAQQQATWHIAN